MTHNGFFFQPTTVLGNKCSHFDSDGAFWNIHLFSHYVQNSYPNFFCLWQTCLSTEILGGGWGRKFFVFVSGKNWCFRICMCEMVITICQTHFAVAENWVLMLICIGDAKNENANNNTFLLFANTGELQLLFLLL